MTISIPKDPEGFEAIPLVKVEPPRPTLLEELTVAGLGIRLVVDDSLPDGVVELRDHEGRTLQRIQDVGGGPGELVETLRGRGSR